MLDNKLKSIADAVNQIITGQKVEEKLDPSVKTTDMIRGRVAGGKKDDVGPGSDGKSTKVKFTPEQLSFKDRLIEKAHQKEEPSIDLDEDDDGMSDAQMKKREKIVLSMKDKEEEFKKKYGTNWKKVMYATATKLAMNEDYQIDEVTTDTLRGRVQGGLSNRFKNYKVTLGKVTEVPPVDVPPTSAAQASIVADGAKEVEVPKAGIKKEEIEQPVQRIPSKSKKYGNSGDQGFPAGVKVTKATPMKIKDVKKDMLKALNSEEVELDEASADLLGRYMKSRGYNPITATKDQKIAMSKSNEFKKWMIDHQTEEVQLEGKGTDTDTPFVQNENPSSNPTPYSKVKSHAKVAYNKVKNETMMGKAGTTSESVEQVDEVAPPGMEKVVKALKKKSKVNNPWAVAWAMKKKKERK